MNKLTFCIILSLIVCILLLYTYPLKTKDELILLISFVASFISGLLIEKYFSS